ncbi:hypothetical protein KTT_02850 [Tengunoibacter tsumagoiensis]|uniref:Uncharacterized protein n=1 Tax=Tengunoibacter tsumagoiensis TaxID=2014871 RepID=A0A401ZUG6_9CHLR|nr:hypothetical protein KTT_02850 [Tengunoibacter tsumagoiensis]
MIDITSPAGVITALTGLIVVIVVPIWVFIMARARRDQPE